MIVISVVRHPYGLSIGEVSNEVTDKVSVCCQCGGSQSREHMDKIKINLEEVNFIVQVMGNWLG